jgi:hypothetical protein
MTIFIPGSTAVENTRNLAQSAIPDAPVVADETHRSRSVADVRAGVGTVLRSVASHALKLADRVDPVCDPLTG